MPKYRNNFNLNTLDVSLIEDALTKRAGEVSQAILSNGSGDGVGAFKKELADIRDLLGRIHNQKIWYQPQDYVPQG